MDDALVQINVAPFQPKQFPSPEARREVDVVQFKHTAAPRFLEEGPQTLRRQNFHLLLLQLRQDTALRGIGRNQPLLHGAVQGGGNHLVDVANCFDAEALGLTAGLRTLHPSALQQMLVQPLEIHCRQFLQRQITEGGLDVVFDEALVGLVGRGPDLEFGIVLHPRVQPLAHGVVLCLQGQDSGFLNRRLELLLDLRLGFTEDVSVDSLPSLRVASRRVASLPSAILSLADAPLSIGTSFRHSVSPPLSATHHTSTLQKYPAPLCGVIKKFVFAGLELLFDYSGAVFEPYTWTFLIHRIVLRDLLFGDAGAFCSAAFSLPLSPSGLCRNWHGCKPCGIADPRLDPRG